jgi:prolyl oligopeptidase PreP (S9A serine peptidase family)
MKDALVRREYAVSKDGTRIPVTIISRKGAPRDGSNPTLLYGYGGYGVSMTPYFSSMLRLWLDYGGKMAASLQAASSSNRPILVRTEAAAGHGIGTALITRIEEQADTYAFLVDQLGMKVAAGKQ